MLTNVSRIKGKVRGVGGKNETFMTVHDLDIFPVAAKD